MGGAHRRADPGVWSSSVERSFTVKSKTDDFELDLKSNAAERDYPAYFTVFAWQKHMDPTTNEMQIDQNTVSLGFIERDDALALADFIYAASVQSVIEPAFLADAPAITDADAPESYAEEMENFEADYGDETEVIDDLVTFDDIPTSADVQALSDEYARGNLISRETARQIENESVAYATKTALEMGDHEGFERGYAAAVDDMRHGLMSDEFNHDECIVERFYGRIPRNGA